MNNYSQIEARIIALCHKTVENKYKLPASYDRNGTLKYDPIGGLWAIFDTIKEVVQFIMISNN